MYGLGTVVLSGTPECRFGERLSMMGVCESRGGAILEDVLSLPARAVEAVAPSAFVGDAMAVKRLAVSVGGWGLILWFLVGRKVGR